MKWTEEEDKILIKLWEANLTATEIIKLMNKKSRNAVLGRIRRLRKSNLNIERRVFDKLKIKKPSIIIGHKNKYVCQYQDCNFLNVGIYCYEHSPLLESKYV